MPVFVEFELPTSDDGRYIHFCSKHQMLRRRRLSLGLTQEQLSERSKVSIQQIQKLELGDITISRLGLKKGLALCAALLLDPYEMAEVDYEQPSILTLQSMPAITHNLPELPDIPANFDEAIKKHIKASNVFVYFNQPFNSSVLISRKALELLEKPKYIQLRWFNREKFFIFTGVETPEILENPKTYFFDVPPETYDNKNLGLMITHFEPIEDTVVTWTWNKEHTYVAKCYDLWDVNQNNRRYFLCNLNTAKKSDKWKGAFTKPRSCL